VPCFNLGAFVEAAVDSAVSQSFTDTEIVVVDDGSTDAATVAVLATLERPRTRVVRSANQGLPAARNLGIRESAGEIICCLDADDLLEPTWIERGLARLDADPDLAFVSHWMQTFGDESWAWTPGDCELATLLDVNSVNSAALVRRAVVDAVGGFDETMRDGCEDWEFWIRVTEAGFRGAIVPEVMYRYRRRPDSMSRRMNASDLRFELYSALMVRHEDAYAERLPDLVLEREAAFARAIHHVDALQSELALAVEPSVREREVERDAARRRAADLRLADDERLEVERHRAAAASRASHLHEVLARVDALEHSLSWRLTAPLRRIALWLRLRGPHR
jgi:glycosyltransferase involved in cell wall biosynthesis